MHGRGVVGGAVRASHTLECSFSSMRLRSCVNARLAACVTAASVCCVESAMLADSEA